MIVPVIRPEKAERVFARLQADSSWRDFEIVTDVDHDRIGCPKMVKLLVSRTQYPWVMFLGDDTLPQTGIILNAMKATRMLPEGWGMVGLNDNFNNGERFATHWMATKWLLPLIGGEFFHTGYRHGYCDYELADRCKELGRYVYAPDAQLLHDHPLIRREPFTGDYARAYSDENHIQDLILYRRRKKNGWK